MNQTNQFSSQPTFIILVNDSEVNISLTTFLEKIDCVIEIPDDDTLNFTNSPQYAAIFCDEHYAPELFNQIEAPNLQTSIVLTGRNLTTEAIAEALKSGAYTFLRYPFEQTRLAGVTAQVIEKWAILNNQSFPPQGSIELPDDVKVDFRRYLESHQILNILTQIVSDAVIRLEQADGDIYIRYINQMGCQIFNYLPQEIVGQNLQILYRDKDTFQSYQQKINEAIQAKESELHLEQALQKQDGSTVWVENVTSFVYIDQELIRIISMLRDITNRKKREAELKKRNETLLALSNIAAAVNQTSNLEHVLTIALNQIEQALGLRHSEIWLLDKETDLLHLTVHRGLPKDFFADVPPFEIGVGLPGIVAETGYPLLITDLETNPRYLRQRAYKYNLACALGVPLMSQDVLMGVMNFFSHISTRFSPDIIAVLTTVGNLVGTAIENAHLLNQAHQELSERERTEIALRESEAKYRTLIEQSNDAIYLIYNEQFEIINRKFEQLLGFNVTEVNTTDFKFIDLVAPKSRQVVEERLKMEAQGVKLPSRYEFTALTQDNREIEIEISVSRFPYKNGTATQGILRDITDRKRFEARLIQAQKMQAVGQLAGGIAHDFNNILAVIAGLATLSLEEATLEKSVYEDLKIIINQAERAATLVNQLLTFARQQTLKFSAVDINQVVANLTRIVQRTMGEKIALKLNLAKNLFQVKADIAALEQILTNLCFNASDAMPKGGNLIIQTENVELDEAYCKTHPTAKPGQYVLLSVVDDGVGMDEETMSRIFDPFFTTKEVGKGTGLGLATVFGLMDQLNGLIEAESTPGKGTTFKLFFPMIMDEDIQPLTSLEDMFADGSIFTGTENILLITDDILTQELMQRVLNQAGYNILVVPDTQMAITMIQSNQIQIELIMIDTHLSKMTGQEFYKAIKALSLKTEPKLMFIGGYEISEFSIEVESNFAIKVNTISKPFSPTSLTAKIRHILDNG